MDEVSKYKFLLTEGITNRNIPTILEYLENSNLDCEKWTTEAARCISNLHQCLRQEINDFGEFWQYDTHCVRLGYHYYNIASNYYLFFIKHHLDLRFVQDNLNKCIQKFNEVSKDSYDEKDYELYNCANNMKVKIDKILHDTLKKTTSTNCTEVCISLGHLFKNNNIFYDDNQYSIVLLNQKAKTILLLRTIDFIEERLSISSSRSKLIIAEHCLQLSLLYKIGKVFDISETFSNVLNSVIKKSFTFEQVEDKQFEIKNIIREEVTKNMISLDDLNLNIQKLNDLHILHSVDKVYIKRKYLKYCLKFWFDDTKRFMQIIKNDFDLLQKIFDNICPLDDLKKLMPPLNHLDSYKLLLSNIDLINENDLKKYLFLFKNDCIDQIKSFCKYTLQEFAFIDAFFNYLNSFKNHKNIATKLKLYWYCMEETDMAFSELITLINEIDIQTYGNTYLKILQDSIALLQKQHFFMNKTFKDLIRSYLMETEIRKRYVDGRQILEVKGKSIVLSDVKREVEKILPQVEEIRFVEADVIHIDENLSKDKWHGKNIVVHTKEIKVYDKVTWDVSGLDNEYKYNSDAGQEPNGDGKRGADGFAGESGGNVMILTEKIDNPSKWTVISHGGNGSDGQDGGRGRDGEDGEGISKEELLTKYPTFTTLFYRPSIQERLNKNLSEIRKCPDIIKIWNTVCGDYANAITKDGHEIILSFSYNASVRQGYFLHKGSRGKPGGKGGEYGMGAQGGFGGEISYGFHNLITRNNDGTKGKNGCGGQYGYFGKNGWDIGYIDYATWSNTRFYGEFQNKVITIKYFDENNSDRIYCSYRDSCREYCYAEFITNELNQSKERKFNEITENRVNEELQHQAKATRKKTISNTSIESRYSIHNIYQDKEIMHEKVLGTLQQSLNTVFENQEQQEQISTQLNLKRNVGFKKSKKFNFNALETTNKKNVLAEYTYEIIMASIKAIPTRAETYLNANKIEMKTDEIFEIYSIYKENRNHFDVSFQNQIEQSLVEKYRSTILYEIHNSFPEYINHKNNEASDTKKFLNPAKENSYNISHPILGNITPYLFVNKEKHRQNIIDFFKDEDCPSIETAVMKFIMKQNGNNNNIKIRKIFNKCQQFLDENDEKIKSSLRIFDESLKNNEYLYYLWVNSLRNNKLKTKFENELEKDKSIFPFYIYFKKYFDNIFSLDEIALDEILPEFRNFILEYGIASECGLELLSKFYDININVYMHSKEHGYVLTDIHNKNPGKESIYVLKNGENLIKLEFNEDFNNLDKDLQSRNDLCGTIIKQILNANSKFLIDKKFNEINAQLIEINKFKINLVEVKSYIFEDSEDTRMKLLKHFRNMSITDIKLHKSLKTFICQTMIESNSPDKIKQHYKNYKDFFKTQRDTLLVLREQMKYEMYKHSNIFLMNDAKERTRMLYEVLKHDKLFEAIYKKFKNTLELNYNWAECCNDQEILKCFKENIHHFGALDPSYRELLSHIFFVNIKVYEKKDRFNLLYDHNPYCKHTIRILKDENNLVPIKESDNNKLEFYESSNAQNLCKILETFDLKQIDENLGSIFDGMFPQVKIVTNPILASNEDKEIVREIAGQFQHPDDIKNVSNFLEKLSRVYIGETNILQSLLKRIKCDGVHVDSKFLCHFVGIVLEFYSEDKEYFDIFNWIILACPQQEWISEVLLIQLEIFFKRKLLEEKRKWRQFLIDINSKHIVLLLSIKLSGQTRPDLTINTINSILYMLSKISKCNINLESIDISMWPCALKEKFWETKLKNLVILEKNKDLCTLSYYIMSMENMFGTDLVEQFIDVINIKKRELSSNDLSSMISNFYNEKWNMSKTELELLRNYKILPWIKKMNEIFSVDDERDATKVSQLVRNSFNTSLEIKENLKVIEKCVNFTEIKSNKNLNKIQLFTENDIENWVKEFEPNKFDLEEVLYETLLAVVDQAIYLKRKIHLRDTQKFTILAFLINKKNSLAQVSTGEGKSLIVVTIAIIRCLLGELVDIVTSSSVLARRDADIFKDIYILFGINISHNCMEDIEKRKLSYSNNKVVYGDLANFQRDYLLDRFYRKNVLGNRNFCNIIVDEVDSMLLDKGNNTLYLSHELPGLDKLESLYIYIWQYINKPVASLEQLLKGVDKNKIREAVIHDIFGTVLKTDLQAVSDEIDEENLAVLYGRLMRNKIIDEEGKLLIDDITKINLNEILTDKFQQYQDEIIFLIRETISRENHIMIPNYLKPFVLMHLDSWIASAETALYLKEGRDYVVDVDRTGTKIDLNPCITIIDKDTGTDQVNSEWEEVLHQFLQLKHGCKLSLQSLKAVFISNVSYFKLYNRLYGLTGTLGSKDERKLLQKIHDVKFITIPTARPKRFEENNPILCVNIEERNNKVKCVANDVINTKHRSVLIICETMNEVEDLYKAFGSKIAKHVHVYLRDYEEFDIANGDKELHPGQIIIATNLAGRGTDIKLADQLKKNGGLHVILTYLPKNSRIEQQAFGRAARCGDMGSGQLIILSTSGQDYTSSQVVLLKTNRDVEEAQRLSEIESLYYNQIKVEEECFEKFRQQYESLKQLLDRNKTADNIKQVLLQSCLDNWAYWLDEHSKLIAKFNVIENKIKFETSFEYFIENMKKIDVDNKRRWYSRFAPKSYEKISSEAGWIQDPNNLVKLAKCFIEEKHYDEALKIFDIVISREPIFSESAHYYKAYALAKSYNWENFLWKKSVSDSKLYQFKTELKEAAKLFGIHSDSSRNASGIISKIKQNTYNNIFKINAYEEQKKAICDYYSIVVQSIEDILGTPLTPQSFVNSTINEELAETIYEDLIQQRYIRKMIINDSIDANLQTLAYNYGTSFEKMKDFILKNKGREIDGKSTDFNKEFKENIKLPTREEFWKILKKEGLLVDEMRYVLVNKERLKNVDPSLLNQIENKLEKQKVNDFDFTKSKNKIYLYTPDQLQHDNTSTFVIKKKEFLNLINNNNEKYKTLKNKCTFTKNKTANVNLKQQIKSFTIFDSISESDFERENIPNKRVAQILKELCEQRVLRKEGYGYKLNISYDKLNDIRLKSYPIYENSIKTLLRFNFTYRITLQKLVAEIADKQGPVGIKLMSKPYSNLIMEMMDLKVIEPFILKEKPKDLEKDLKILYSRYISSEKLKQIIMKYNILSKKVNLEKLVKQLKQKNWVGQNDITGQVFINQNMEYHLEESFDEFEATLQLILSNRFTLSEHDNITALANIIEQSVSILARLETPNPDLEYISENSLRNINIQEVALFHLNGLDKIIKFTEKKWTLKMILSVLAVILIGIIQIVIGALIEWYSAGVMTHVGNAFISEGVSDIIYSLGALNSGYFSWKDYGKHKIQSVLMTTISVGVGAYFSKGVKVNRIGWKVAGPSAEFAEKKVVETTGRELCKALENVGKKVVYKEIGKRIALKTIEGIAMGAANVAVDRLVENCLQKHCAELTYKILTDIEKEVSIHPISHTLEKMYKYLGHDKTKEMVFTLTDKYFKDKSVIEKFGPHISKIAGSFMQGMAEASKKMNRLKETEMSIPINLITKIITWGARGLNIADLIYLTKTCLDGLNKEMNKKLESTINKKSLSPEIPLDQQYKVLKTEITNKWKQVLRDKVGQVVTQNIVSPILNEGANVLVRSIGKLIQKGYNSYKESGYTKQIEERKQQYRDELEGIGEEQEDRDQIIKDIRDKYHKDLINVMKKTRNPKLFAAIIKEQVPMDVTCVTSCTQVIHRMLGDIGIHGIKIVIKEEGGFKQEISSTNDNNEGVTVNLTIRDNHFVLTDGNDNSLPNQDNNCLFYALSQQIPQLRSMSSDEFRRSIINHIETDPSMHNLIQRGWHNYAISQGAIGGARQKRKDSISRNEINDSIENDAENGKYTHETYKYDSKKDVDLRENRDLSISELNDQRAKAFNKALLKINENLAELQNGKKDKVFLHEGNFETTLSDRILMRTRFGNNEVGFCPVEMQAIFEMKVGGNLVKYVAEINLDNPDSCSVENGPRGPHVGWKISGSIGKVCGHVLINKKGNEFMPRREKASPFDRDFRPLDKDVVQINAWRRHVPPTRMFYAPHRPSSIVHRVESFYVEDIDPKARRNPFVSVDW